MNKQIGNFLNKKILEIKIKKKKKNKEKKDAPIHSIM